jgi:hypothetical protein
MAAYFGLAAWVVVWGVIIVAIVGDEIASFREEKKKKK